MRETMHAIVESLKRQPLALGLVVVNLSFLITFTLLLREISNAVERKDVFLTELSDRCGLLPKGDRQ
jgi:hypothetical protein